MHVCMYVCAVCVSLLCLYTRTEENSPTQVTQPSPPLSPGKVVQWNLKPFTFHVSCGGVVCPLLNFPSPESQNHTTQYYTRTCMKTSGCECTDFTYIVIIMSSICTATSLPRPHNGVVTNKSKSCVAPLLLYFIPFPLMWYSKP